MALWLAMVTCSAEVMGSNPSSDGFFGVLSEKKKNPVPQWSVAIPLYKERYGGSFGSRSWSPTLLSLLNILRVSVNSHNSPNDLGASFFFFFFFFFKFLHVLRTFFTLTLLPDAMRES